jgi:MFS family permease
MAAEIATTAPGTVGSTGSAGGTGSAVPAAPARLMNRNFFLLWQGQTVSQLGNQAFSVAMAFWLMRATGSASLMGLLMTFAVLPGVLLSPFGGTFADRHSRIRIIVVCDLLSGLGVLVLGFLMLGLCPDSLGAACGSPQRLKFLIAVLFVIAVGEGVVRSFFMPAISAAIPGLVPRDRVAAANSMNQFSVQTSVFLGQAVGGVLYRLIGAPLLYIFDGLTFLFSAGSAAFIAGEPVPARPKTALRQVLREFWQETLEGLRYVRDRPGLRDFVVIATLLNFLVMPIFVLFPFFVERNLGGGAQWYGFLLASISAGSVAGFLLAGTLKLRGDTRAWTLVGCLVGAPLLHGSLGFVHLPALALVLAFAGGVGYGMVNIYIMTLLQTSTPNELRGRVIGLLATLGGALVPLGMALGGFVGDLTGKNIPLIYGTCGALSASITLALATRPECRVFLKQD